jgi:hypothetical protein
VLELAGPSGRGGFEELGARHNIFLRLAKSGNLCRMRAPDLPERVFGKPSEEISLMAATRQARPEVDVE